MITTDRIRVPFIGQKGRTSGSLLALEHALPLGRPHAPSAAPHIPHPAEARIVDLKLLNSIS
jgi:hypothetical protein